MTFHEILNQDKSVLVDFFAEWCGPCKMMSPILKEVKCKLQEDISIIKIDLDKNKSLVAKHQVKGVPTFFLVKNGKQLWRQSGMLQKNDIITIIKNHA